MKRRLTILALTALAVMALSGVVLTVPTPAHAGGATQFSGIGYSPGGPNGRACDNPPAFPGDPNDVIGILALDFTGDLEGCFYSYVLSYESSPSGTYRERGNDIFVGEYKGEAGTFETTYLFTAKFEDVADPATEIHGRCQHPIVAGSGSGVFKGVSGRVDIKDVIGGDTITFNYRGHLRW